YTLPDRHSCCPEAISTKIPIWCTLHSLLESAVLDMFREPVDVFVMFYHLLSLAIYVHKPARVSSVHEFCTTAMAMRIAVLDIINLPNNPTFTQCLGNFFIDFPDLLALPFTFGVVTFIIGV